MPTILVAGHTSSWGDDLARRLEQQGYLVLRSRDDREALSIAIRHSRPIHVIVTEWNTEGRVLAERLKPYRLKMKVLFAAVHRETHDSDVENVLLKVQHALGPSAGP